MMKNYFHISSPVSKWKTGLILSLVALAIGLGYAQALPGRLLFDDSSNLDALMTISNWSTALEFIFSGTAGPLGRPLSLATFALQANAWPDHPADLLRVNFAIHLAAVYASFFLATGLARIRSPNSDSTPIWIGIGVASLWGLSPFLATTHLIIIQRMTSLAGFFVLAGLAVFVWAHILAANRPRIARACLVFGLGVVTMLATLSKENGALLPVLALVILWLWIPRDRRLFNPVDRILVVLFAVLPSAMLVSYLTTLLPTIIDQGYGPIRYFTPTQRLLSQPEILLDYLKNLLVPNAASVSPFMDRLPAPKGWLEPPSTVFSMLFWTLSMAMAIWLRRAAPYVLFGLSFFFAGHLLESGFLGLELYFAHRNYVPAFGLYFGLVFGLSRIPTTYRRLAVAGLITYTVMFGVVLLQVTSTWSQSQFIGETWLAHNPHSERAAQFLAAAAAFEGDPVKARYLFDFAAERNPRLPLIQIQRTGICLGQEKQYPALLNEVLEHLKTAIYEPHAAVVLVKVARESHSKLCPMRDHSTLNSMADALLSNPLYENNPLVKSHLLLAKGFATIETQNAKNAIDYALQAYRLNSNPDIALFTASIMARSGQIGRAMKFLDQLTPPIDQPIKRAAWSKRLDDFRRTELIK